MANKTLDADEELVLSSSEYKRKLSKLSERILMSQNKQIKKSKDSQNVRPEMLCDTLYILYDTLLIRAVDMLANGYIFRLHEYQFDEITEIPGSKMYMHFYPVPIRVGWDEKKTGTRIPDPEYFRNDFAWTDKVITETFNIFKAFIQLYDGLEKVTECNIHFQITEISNNEVGVTIYSQFAICN